ncbi:MAG: hypothetical protein K2N69_02775 [Helicobacter sp.]|nr:hypothetical protein [Helicobacter sp.]
MKDSLPVACFGCRLAMTENNIGDAESSAQCVRPKSHLQYFNVIASKQQPKISHSAPTQKLQNDIILGLMRKGA